MARLVGHVELSANMGDRTPVAAFAHAGLLHDFACGDVYALEDTRFGQDIVMAFDHCPRADSLQVSLRGNPEALGRDVTRGVLACLYAEGRTTVTGSSQDEVARACSVVVDEVAEAIAPPKRFSRLGIEGEDALGKAHEQFVATMVIPQDGRAPTSEPVLLVFALRFGQVTFPDGFSRGGIECQYEYQGTRTSVLDEGLAIGHGTGGCAPEVTLLAEILASPDFLSFEVVGDHACRPEGDYDHLAVRGGRSGTERVRLVCGFFIGE